MIDKVNKEQYRDDKIAVVCKECRKTFYVVKHAKGEYCQSCRTKLSWKNRARHYDDDVKQRKAKLQYQTKLKTGAIKPKKTVKCLYCNKEFSVFNKSKKKYCSTNCQHANWNNAVDKEKHRKAVRESVLKAVKEGRWTQSFHQRGIGGKRNDLENKYFRSRYEANFARLLNHNNIKWEYETLFLKLTDDRVYIPDFFIPEQNLIIEIKGYQNPKTIQKFFDAKSLYNKKYNFRIIMGHEWKQIDKEYRNIIKNWE